MSSKLIHSHSWHRCYHCYKKWHTEDSWATESDFHKAYDAEVPCPHCGGMARLIVREVRPPKNESERLASETGKAVVKWLRDNKIKFVYAWFPNGSSFSKQYREAFERLRKGVMVPFPKFSMQVQQGLPTLDDGSALDSDIKVGGPLND